MRHQAGDDARAKAGLAEFKFAQGEDADAIKLLESANSPASRLLVRENSLSANLPGQQADQRRGKRFRLSAQARDTRRARSMYNSARTPGSQAIPAGAYDALAKAEPLCSDDRNSALELAEFQKLVGNNQNAIRTYFRVLNQNSGDETTMRRVAGLRVTVGE